MLLHTISALACAPQPLQALSVEFRFCILPSEFTTKKSPVMMLASLRPHDILRSNEKSRNSPHLYCSIYKPLKIVNSIAKRNNGRRYSLSCAIDTRP